MRLSEFRGNPLLEFDQDCIVARLSVLEVNLRWMNPQWPSRDGMEVWRLEF